MSDDEKYAAEATKMIKVELMLRNVGYRELAKRLTDAGIPENEINVKTKINRGRFSFLFFVQVMRVIQMDVFDLRRFDVDTGELKKRD